MNAISDGVSRQLTATSTAPSLDAPKSSSKNSGPSRSMSAPVAAPTPAARERVVVWLDRRSSSP